MAALVFIFGLAIGSFLNVLIVRLPDKKSIRGFSKCPKCRAGINWYDNVPVLSFLFLKGRCRNCGTKISFQYPSVELLTAFLFLFSFFAYSGDSSFFFFVLFLVGLLTAVAFIDLDRFLILDNFILAGFFVSALYFSFYFFASPPPDCRILSCSAASSVFGSLFFGGSLLFLFLLTKGRGMGLGDVNLGAFLGFIFGFKNSANVFVTAFLIGFVVAIILLTFKKAGLKSKVPFGSIIAAAGILFLLSGFNLFDLAAADLILRLWSR